MKNKTILLLFLLLIFSVCLKFVPDFYYHRGMGELNRKDYVSAYKNLKKAYSLNDKNKDYRYGFVEALSHLAPSITVQKQVFEIANDSYNDSAHQKALNIIGQWREKITIDFGDNYIEQVPTDTQIIRWDESKFPIKTAITSDSKEVLPEYYKTEILKALSQWQASTGFIKFQTVDNVKNANIVIKITPTPANICNESICRYVVGYTTPDYSGKKLNQMVITLYDKDANGNFFSDKELYNTILHETGHALGIMGHSYSSEDLMYMDNTENKTFYAPYRSSFQYLSSKDINTIKLLYKLLPDITNSDKVDYTNLIYPPIVLGTSEQINNRKINEAKNYIRKNPKLMMGYIDLASAYSTAGKDKESLKILHKALSLANTENEKYICFYNIAVVYLNLNNPDKALTYANKAKEISDDNSVKDLIMNITHLRTKK